MNHRTSLAALLLLAICAALGTVACSDSPTDNGSAPTVSQLQVSSASRLSGNEGLVGVTFQYADPDSDVDRAVFRVEGAGSATSGVSDANQTTGQIGLQQAVNLPSAGTRVDFAVYVLDRKGHKSNELPGSFVAP